MLKWFGYFFLFPLTKCSFFAASRMKKTIYFSDCVDDNLKRELLLVKCICTLYNNRHPLGTFLCILRLVSWYIWTYRHPILGPFLCPIVICIVHMNLPTPIGNFFMNSPIVIHIVPTLVGHFLLYSTTPYVCICTYRQHM